MGKDIGNRIEIKEIIEKKINFFIRWGITIFLLIIIIAFVIACLFDILSISIVIEKIMNFI